ncbi:HEPN domain-containing protein [Phaeobacter gallaeciensis]|uniref:HEPN domain-containing protein n=1 Tax=Phaeobacter gallaeciensis TaxID=60890 RepID=UPI000BC0C5B4|nr:HEPN domain-containing protein [Phaeobacter gallaeciensis]ATF17836.1 hypothetical protein PhaeoP129_01194 [Phaeobacter gallaeciensis]ATF21945.1 hypothetical protein PhaeoP128_01194 [Phaeobacter gallaeciensis]
MNNDIIHRNVHARSLVWKMYRDAADEDYIASRACAKMGLRFNFFWSAQQALEKILKATLLLNGHECLKVGHNICKAFEISQEIAGDLLPKIHIPHNSLRNRNFSFGYTQTTLDFVSQINLQGDTNNRYRHYGTTFQFADLYKLDELYFMLRRTAFPLDMKETVYGSYREYLKNNRSTQLHRFYCLGRSDSGLNDRKTTFEWCNFAFCEETATKEGTLNTGISGTNSVLYNTAQSGHDGIEALEWIITAAYFSNSDKREIRELIESSHKART